MGYPRRGVVPGSHIPPRQQRADMAPNEGPRRTNMGNNGTTRGLLTIGFALAVALAGCGGARDPNGDINAFHQQFQYIPKTAASGVAPPTSASKSTSGTVQVDQLT